MEQVGLPPFVFGEDGGEADLQAPAKVLANGSAGTHAVVQLRNLHALVARRRAAQQYYAPSQHTRNVSLLGEEVENNGPPFLNLAVCPCLSDGSGNQRVANNLNARMRQMAAKFPTLGFRQKAGPADEEPADVPTNAWLLPLGARAGDGAGRTWAIICGCQANMKTRKYQTRLVTPEPGMVCAGLLVLAAPR